MHSGYCIDRSVSYALDREQIVMPKTIFIGCASEERPKSIAKKLRPAGQYDQRLQAGPQEGRPCAVTPTPVVHGCLRPIGDQPGACPHRR
jgi:hypothetical protein